MCTEVHEERINELFINDSHSGFYMEDGGRI